MIKITLKIEGMMCGNCSGHMDEAILREFNVKKVASSHETKQSIIISQDDIPDDKLREVVEATGFELISVSREPYKKGLFSFLKG